MGEYLIADNSENIGINYHVPYFQLIYFLYLFRLNLQILLT